MAAAAVQVWDVVPGPRETATIPCRTGVVAVAVPGGAGAYSWCTWPGWGAAGAAPGAAESGHAWAWGAAMGWSSAAPGQDVLAPVEPAGAETVCAHVLIVHRQQTGPWQIP